ITASKKAMKPVSPTAAQDIVRGFLKWRLWGRLGWLEVRRRYRRTVIGPFWSTISLAAYVIAVGSVGAGLWNQNIQQYLPFLVSGMLVWMVISTIGTESCALFLSRSLPFLHFSFDYSILAYALIWRNFITFLHNLIVYILVVVVLAPNLVTPSLLLAIPGIVLVLSIGTWFALLCGMFCLRFRDTSQLITSIMQIAIFVTPIFWPADTLKGILPQLIFVELNPLYHIVDVVRAPLLGKVPAPASYAAVLGMVIFGWALTYVI